MRREFVELAEKRTEPFAALCARFGISRKTGYKWLKRFRAAGEAGLCEQSRRPRTSPRRTPDAVVDAVLAARQAHTDWSVARLQAALAEQGVVPLPAQSTIDLILRRQRVTAAARLQALGPEAQRTEPNFRWIFQHGAEVTLTDGTLAEAVVVRDETTDFLVGAVVLTGRREEALTVFTQTLVRRHGLPWRVLLPRAPQLRGAAPCRAHTPLSVWLMQAGVTVDFLDEGPDRVADEAQQRQLVERLAALPAYQRASLAGRLLPDDVLARFARSAAGLTLAAAQAALPVWREQHNFGGKQEALQQRGPLTRYRPSVRSLPTTLDTPAAEGAEMRLVSEKGIFTFQRRLVHVGRAFAGTCVELKPTPYPERFMVLFAGQMLGVVNVGQVEADHTTSLPLSPS